MQACYPSCRIPSIIRPRWHISGQNEDWAHQCAGLYNAAYTQHVWGKEAKSMEAETKGSEWAGTEIWQLSRKHLLYVPKTLHRRKFNLHVALILDLYGNRNLRRMHGYAVCWSVVLFIDGYCDNKPSGVTNLIDIKLSMSFQHTH
jgi:hypothetical protein